MVTINKNEICHFLSPEMKLLAKLEFGPDSSYQFMTRLLGYKPDQALILDYPHSANEALIMRNLNNTTIVIKGMSDTEMGHIVAFTTSVMQSLNRPFPMLFVRMPKHFVTKAVRHHKRIKISLPVVIQELQGKQDIEGTLVDFSVSGCGVFIDDKKNVGKDNFLHKGTMALVKCELTECIDTPMQSRVARIANIVKHPGGHMIGLQFSDTIPLNDSLKNLLLEHTVLDRFL